MPSSFPIIKCSDVGYSPTNENEKRILANLIKIKVVRMRSQVDQRSRVQISRAVGFFNTGEHMIYVIGQLLKFLCKHIYIDKINK